MVGVGDGVAGPPDTAALADDGVLDRAVAVRELDHCPGRNPRFWVIKRPPHPHNSAIQNRFTVETLRALNRPGRARTVLGRRELHLVPRGLKAGLKAGPRSQFRFRNRGTDYFSESGMKWVSVGTKRQCDRALRRPR